MTAALERTRRKLNNCANIFGVLRMRSPLTIGLLPLPRFTLTPFASLLDVLRLAADEGDRSRPEHIRWSIIGVGLEPIASSCGAAVAPWETLGDPSRFDYIVVCGGLLTRDHRGDAAVEAFLRDAAAAGIQIVALCTAVFSLAAAGLLDRRKACVSWFHAAEFADLFAATEADASQLFVVDGPFITCSGGTGAADVGALIVERHLGAGAARKALDILQIEQPRASAHPQTSASVVDGGRDELIARITLMIEQSLDRRLSSNAIAAEVGLSRRQLERTIRDRTGLSPQQFAMNVRLVYADWLVRGSKQPLTAVAQRCGFSDSSHLSRCYRSAFGMPPSHARRGERAFIAGERRPYQSRSIASDPRDMVSPELAWDGTGRVADAEHL